MSEYNEGFASRAPYFLGGVALVQNFLAGGIFYGWVGLAQLLARESTVTTVQLHNSFVLASSLSLLSPLLLGVLLDRKGPRACFCVCMLLVGCGSLIFGLCDITPGSVTAGISLIAFGGSAAQNALMHVSNLFPKGKSLFISLMTVSYQLSACIFTVFAAMNGDGLPLRAIFLGYTGIIAFLLIVGAVLWPDKPYSILKPNARSSSKPPMCGQPKPLGLVRLPTTFQRPEAGSDSRVGGALAEPLMAIEPSNESADVLKLRASSLWRQLSSGEFMRLNIFFTVGSFWCNFYLGTIDTQLSVYQSEVCHERGLSLSLDEIPRFLSIFNMVITGSAVLIPVAGWMLDTHGFGATMLLTLTLGILMAVGALSCGGQATVVSTFVLYALFRNCVFSYTFAALAHLFGFRYFGVLAGVVFACAGLVGLLQTPVASIDDWALINEIQLGMVALLYVFPLYSIMRNRRKTSESPKIGPLAAVMTDDNGDEVWTLATVGKRKTLFRAYGSIN
jgi:MFS family permease